MAGGSSEGSEARFAGYVEALGGVLGHADRQEPMRDYCLGLLMPIERKSVEPMAAVTAPAQVAAKHQSLLHFVGNAPWSDAAMLARVGELVLPAIERSGPIEAWIIDDETEPTKYWFSTLSEDTAFARLIDLTKLRWRIERDYQELKQELGLGDYEGRGWRGFHHHSTLCIAAYGFLIAERGALPPSGPLFSAPLSRSAIPDGYRRRGAADPTRTAHPKFDRDHAATPHRRSRKDPPEMPLLQCADPQDGKNSRLLTQ